VSAHTGIQPYKPIPFTSHHRWLDLSAVLTPKKRMKEEKLKMECGV
jgi:hypothetical protein